MATTITAEELSAHIESLSATIPDRKPGYATKKEMARALFLAGIVTTYSAAKNRVDRAMEQLFIEGRLENEKVITRDGPSGNPYTSTAFKILPAPKSATPAKRKR